MNTHSLRCNGQTRRRLDTMCFTSAARGRVRRIDAALHQPAALWVLRAYYSHALHSIQLYHADLARATWRSAFNQPALSCLSDYDRTFAVTLEGIGRLYEKGLVLKYWCIPAVRYRAKP